MRWITASVVIAALASITAAVLVTASDTLLAQSPPPQTQAQSPPPPAQAAPKPANIDRNGVLMLVRATLLALDQANKTGNYTVLRDIGAPGFQLTNTAARLAEIFAKQRNDKLDLSGVAVIDPQLTLLPQIEASGMMHMSGFFPSVPSQVNFELLFAPIDSQWRLFGMSVNVGQSGPVAPAPPQDAPTAALKQPQAAVAKKPPAPPKEPKSDPPPKG